MKWSVFILFFSLSAWAKPVAEPMTVVKMNWSQDKKMYRLTMLKHAAVYWAPKSLESCLLESLKSQKDHQMSFETKTLKLSNCKKPESSN